MVGFSGFWRVVLRGILGWRRGVNGQFYPEIPGVLRWVRVQRGDSAHGGHMGRDWAENFLKTGRKTQKLGWERRRGAPI